MAAALEGKKGVVAEGLDVDMSLLQAGERCHVGTLTY
jgi:hypothetical protein